MSETATKAIQLLDTREVELSATRHVQPVWQTMCSPDREVNHTGAPNGAYTDKLFSAEALTGGPSR